MLCVFKWLHFIYDSLVARFNCTISCMKMVVCIESAVQVFVWLISCLWKIVKRADGWHRHSRSDWRVPGRDGRARQRKRERTKAELMVSVAQV